MAEGVPAPGQLPGPAGLPGGLTGGLGAVTLPRSVLLGRVVSSRGPGEGSPERCLELLCGPGEGPGAGDSRSAPGGVA